MLHDDFRAVIRAMSLEDLEELQALVEEAIEDGELEAEGLEVPDRDAAPDPDSPLGRAIAALERQFGK